MALADQMTVGGAILPTSHFNESGGFYNDFSGDRSQILQPENDDSKHSRKGLLKTGFYGQGVVSWASSQWGPAQINAEQQHYISPYDPNPSGYEAYTFEGGNLKTNSRPTTSQERGQYFIKGYYLAPGGRQAQRNWFRASNGFPNGPPGDWRPNNENWDSEPTDGSPRDPQNTGGVIMFQRLPAGYLAGMVSSLGRYQQSFGRFMCRGRNSIGGRGHLEDDIRNVVAHFPALFWLLRAIDFKRDLNGQYRAASTHMPANPNADGILEELDANEQFSEGRSDRIVHQTMHWHDGRRKLQDASGVSTSFDTRAGLHDYGVDIIPKPGGGGKIGFIIDGVYRRVLDMPDHIRDQLAIYPVAPNGWQPALGSNGVARRVGSQTHPSGDPKFMQWFFLTNMARDSKLVRDAVRNYGNYDKLPAYDDYAFCEVEYYYCAPLLDDNPDEYGVTRFGIPQKTDATGFSTAPPPSGGGVIGNPNNPGANPGGAGGAPVIPIPIPNAVTPNQAKRPRRLKSTYSTEGAGGVMTYEVEAPREGETYLWNWSAWGTAARVVGPDDGPRLQLRIVKDTPTKEVRRVSVSARKRSPI